MSNDPRRRAEGPFRADQLRPDDPYELAHGHPVECLPSGGRHAKANLTGGLSLGTDPDVESAGFDPGYAPDPKNLRAPDIAVGNVPDRPGWVEGVPPLAVEYADTGQDEQDLADKIATLLAGGTRFVWVVRIAGPRWVEVYEPGQPRRLLHPGEQLRAPGVLRNPVPVEALYDPAAAQGVALRNLLQRQGYADLDAVRAETELSLVLRQLERRLHGLSAQEQQAIRGLPAERVSALGEVLVDFAAKTDLVDWLQANA